MGHAPTFAALAVVPPGLETVASEELVKLGAQSVKTQRGAVAFATDP
ncbi:MAG: class I SAM-dependent RNA methyltransferase, partial [Cyanobium sp.]